jgi:hypothetical protein
MQKEFVSGDLQKLYTATKERITHLGRAVGLIEPEIERVEGTGRSHRYSFRNAMQFGVAHYLSKSGLVPAEIRRALQTLDAADRGESPEGLTVRGLQPGQLFDPATPLLTGFSLIRVESVWHDKPTKPGLVKFALMTERGFLDEEEELAREGKRIFGYNVVRLDTIKKAVTTYAAGA